MSSMYNSLLYLDPLRHDGSAASVAFTLLPELPTMNAPNAAPPIISSSSGCSIAATCPPASANPPNTEATTITYPRSTSIAASVHRGVEGGSHLREPRCHGVESECGRD